MADPAESVPETAGEQSASAAAPDSTDEQQQQQQQQQPQQEENAAASPGSSAAASAETPGVSSSEQLQEPRAEDSSEVSPSTEQQDAPQQQQGDATPSPTTLRSEPSTPIPRKRDPSEDETSDGQPPAKKRKLDNGTSEAAGDSAASATPSPSPAAELKTEKKKATEASSPDSSSAAPGSRHQREHSDHDIEEVIRGLEPTADNVAAILKRLSRDELAHLVGRCVEKHPDLLRFVAEQAHVERENSRKVFVRQISFGATEDDLEKAFSEFGPVESARLALNARRESKGFGFVTFRTVQASAEALKARTLEVSGRTCIIVAYDESEKPSRRSFRGGDRFSDRGGGDRHHDSYGSGRSHGGGGGGYRGGGGGGDRHSERPRSLPMQRDRGYDRGGSDRHGSSDRHSGRSRGGGGGGYEGRGSEYASHHRGGSSSRGGDYDDRGASSAGAASSAYDPYGSARGAGGGGHQYYDDRAAAAAAAAAAAYYQQHGAAAAAHGYDPSGGYGAPAASAYGREGYY